MSLKKVDEAVVGCILPQMIHLIGPNTSPIVLHQPQASYKTTADEFPFPWDSPHPLLPYTFLLGSRYHADPCLTCRQGPSWVLMWGSTETCCGARPREFLVPHTRTPGPSLTHISHTGLSATLLHNSLPGTTLTRAST